MIHNDQSFVGWDVYTLLSLAIVQYWGITSGGGAQAIQLMSKPSPRQPLATNDRPASPPGTPPPIDEKTNAHMHLISRDTPETSHSKNRSVAFGGNKRKSPSGRRSVNSQEERQQLSETSSSFLSKKTESTSRTRTPSDLFQPSRLGTFECPCCRGGNSPPCATCHDSRMLSQDHHLIRFLSYLIDFKLGRRQSYPLPAAPPEEFQSMRQQGKALRATQPARMGQGQGERLSMKERRSECVNIHYGYFCDGCSNEEPIIGARFHCLACEDYDLCEECHRNRGHRHLMAEIPVSSSYRHSLKSWELLSQRQQRGTLGGVKALSGRIGRLEQKVHSSNIR